MFSTGVACRKISDDTAIGTTYYFAHHLTINSDGKKFNGSDYKIFSGVRKN